MSDFLSNLAAKNLNRVPVIQPRPLSLFEPADPRTTPGPELRPEHAGLDFSDSIESYTPHRVMTARRPAGAATLPPSEPLDSGVEVSAHQARWTPPLRLEPSSIAPQRLAQQRKVQPEIVNVTHIRSVIEQPLSRTPDGERPISEKESPVPQRAVPPIGIEVAARPTINEEPAQAAPPPIVTPVIERLIHAQENIESSPAPSPSEPRASHTLPPSAAQQPATEPSTIHVTIGRIEVRATPPAATAKRSTPASATLSLDEYLRARDGGRR